MSVTFDDVIAQGKVLSDKTNDPSLDATFWASAGNDAIEQLWQEVVKANRDYWLKFHDDSIPSSGMPFLDLSSITDDTSGGWRMRKLRLVERNPTAVRPTKIVRRTLATKDVTRWPRGYLLVGKNLYIDPAPLAPGDYRVWYVPGPKIYALGADPPDDLGSRLIPYREFLETYVAIKALAQEESDTSALEGHLALLRANLISTVADEDAAGAQHVQDTEAAEELAGFPWLPRGF